MTNSPNGSVLSWVYTGEHLADLDMSQGLLVCGEGDIH